MTRPGVSPDARRRPTLAGTPAAPVLQLLLASTALALVAGQALPARANPTDPTVRAGTVSIHQQGRTLTVEQGSSRAIIDWRGFDIAADELTRFDQPSADAIALNRVTGANPSQILGRLEANGQLMLVNPNGIVFGPASRVDVAGLVATTADIRDDDFLAGRYEFDIPSPNPDAAVVNHGQITVAEAGYAALVAPSVRNSGSIDARLGRITLAGAEGFALDLYGDNLVVFRVPVATAPRDEAGDPVPALVRNTGSLTADGGTVTLAASQVGSVVRSVVNTDGIVQANTISREGGRIVLGVAGEGDVDVSGTLAAVGDDPGEQGGAIEIAGDSVAIAEGAVIDARGAAGGGEIGVAALDDATVRMALLAAAHIELTADLDRSGWGDGAEAASGGTALLGDAAIDASAAGGAGGYVAVTGDRVTLDGATTIDASGPAGGGTVLIGGEYLGRGALRTADRTILASEASVRADALEAGDGGTVILWSDDLTLFGGLIEARGGPEGGDGGFVETSGLRLGAFGLADASAAAGEAGTWLLDPWNVTIGPPAADCLPSECSITGDADQKIIDAIQNVTIPSSQIVSALNSGTDVTVTTGPGTGIGSILVNDKIEMTGPFDASLTLISGGIISVAEPIEATDAALSVFLDAWGTILIGESIDTNGGSFGAESQALTINGDIETDDGSISIAVDSLDLLRALSTDAGDIDISVTGDAAVARQVTSTGGDIDIRGQSVILSSNVVSAGGNVSLTATLEDIYRTGTTQVRSGFGDVTLVAARDILDMDVAAAGAVTAEAGRDIVFNEPASGATVSLWADTDGDGDGRLSLNGAVTAAGLLDLGAARIDVAALLTGETVSLDGGAGGATFAAGAGIDAGAGGAEIAGTLGLAAGNFAIETDNGPIALGQVTGDPAGSTLGLQAGLGSITAAGFDLGGAGSLTAVGGTVGLGTRLIANTATLTGSASGTGLNVALLDVRGSDADLQGSVAGMTGEAAAMATLMPDSASHLVNDCRVSGCPAPPAPEPEPLVEADPDPVPEPEPVVEAEPEPEPVEVPPSIADPTRLAPPAPAPTPAPPMPVETAGAGPAAGGGAAGDQGAPDASPESEVAAIEAAPAAGAPGQAPGGEPGGSAGPGVDPALMPGFDAGLANLSRLLQSGDLDDGELRRIADELEDPAVSDIARELLALLEGGGGGGDRGVPQDAFGGATSVVIPGLATYRPAAGERTAALGMDGVFHPPGFALFQF